MNSQLSTSRAPSLPPLLLMLLLARRLLLLLALQEEARQNDAAITIQSFWRAVRARHLTTIQRALFKIRQIQGGASKGKFHICCVYDLRRWCPVPEISSSRSTNGSKVANPK